MNSNREELDRLQTLLVTTEEKLKNAQEQERLALAKKGAADRQLDVARKSKNAFEELVQRQFLATQGHGTHERAGRAAANWSGATNVGQATSVGHRRGEASVLIFTMDRLSRSRREEGGE